MLNLLKYNLKRSYKFYVFHIVTILIIALSFVAGIFPVYIKVGLATTLVWNIVFLILCVLTVVSISFRRRKAFFDDVIDEKSQLLVMLPVKTSLHVTVHFLISFFEVLFSFLLLSLAHAIIKNLFPPEELIRQSGGPVIHSIFSLFLYFYLLQVYIILSYCIEKN